VLYTVPPGGSFEGLPQHNNGFGVGAPRPPRCSGSFKAPPTDYDGGFKGLPGTQRRFRGGVLYTVPPGGSFEGLPQHNNGFGGGAPVPRDVAAVSRPPQGL